MDKSTSKKTRKARAAELTQIVQKPLEIFFEEKLQYQLVDTKANPVMKSLFTAIAASKFIYHIIQFVNIPFFLDGTIEDSNLVDEMIRQV